MMTLRQLKQQFKVLQVKEFKPVLHKKYGFCITNGVFRVTKGNLDTTISKNLGDFLIKEATHQPFKIYQ